MGAAAQRVSRAGGWPAADVAIVCALRCEADPVIERFSLSPRGDGSIWFGDRVTLARSGAGADAAAAAVERLTAHTDDASCWINLGCAGGQGPLGELVAAHRVSAAGCAESWYPQFPFPVVEPTVDVCTVASVEAGYPDPERVYEMEAAGFYRRALRRASLERVQVLKVRVDGPDHPVERLSATSISAAVAARAEAIGAWVERLAAIAATVRARRPDSAIIDAYLEWRRFSVSQQVQLRRILARLRALSIEIPPVARLDAGDAAAVLRQLGRRLEVDR